ncbi:S41 family peptidase [Micavibrio aeruginosavorus]|uniref:Peptidase family protein n=1 Tax=Micavibrio aeruginosavorus (strain ARL-13) TaxID=856793 RepID=G2KQ58_MICAA|nr:S41 family peptidase [Micavibrio aeruginosavorus]AEP08600.1 peptidase family protein [Micavibrio aeruginosavorus ARL-13]
MRLQSKTLSALFLTTAIGLGLSGCATTSDNTAATDAPKPSEPVTTGAKPRGPSPYTIDLGSREEFERIMVYGIARRLAEDNSVMPQARDRDKMLQGAVDGMLKTLTPHDAYITAEDMKGYMSGKPETLKGIGAGLEKEKDKGRIIVQSLVEGGPAEKTGLQIGDAITHVNGQSILDMDIAKAIDLIRGEKGTPVTLNFERDGKPQSLTIIRDEVVLKPVDAKLIGDIAYVRLASFMEGDVDTQVADAFKKLEAKAGTKPVNGYILDLRYNGGGRLDMAAEITDLFVDPQDMPIVDIRGANGVVKHAWTAEPGDMLNGKNMVVLINGGSASASEIVAGALQDFNRATLIGTPSFGKGSAQAIMPFGMFIPGREDGIKITNALYHLPTGRSIQNIGITPDILVEGIDESNIKHERDLANNVDNPNGDTEQKRTQTHTCTIKDGVTWKNLGRDYRWGRDDVDKALLCAIKHLNSTTGTASKNATITPVPQPKP